MTELDVARHSRLIDPQLHVWGWEIPMYLFLGGAAAGLMILGSLLAARREGGRSAAARWLPFAAPALVSLGMGALFLDLAGKGHVARFYLAFRWTSPMSWGAWILLVVYPVTLLFALAGLESSEAARVEAALGRAGLSRLAARGRSFALRHAQALARLHLWTGVALGVYTGILLSTLGARALWSSALLGPLFLASGFSAGAAVALLAPLGDRERHAVAAWDRRALLLELVLLALVAVGLATGGAEGKEALRLLLAGAYAAPFFLLVVTGGIAVPLALGVLETRLGLRPIAAAPALVLAGGLALRWILVAAGQA